MKKGKVELKELGVMKYEVYLTSLLLIGMMCVCVCVRVCACMCVYIYVCVHVCMLTFVFGAVWSG